MEHDGASESNTLRHLHEFQMKNKRTQSKEQHLGDSSAEHMRTFRGLTFKRGKWARLSVPHSLESTQSQRRVNAGPTKAAIMLFFIAKVFVLFFRIVEVAPGEASEKKQEFGHAARCLPRVNTGIGTDSGRSGSHTSCALFLSSSHAPVSLIYFSI